MTKLLTDEEIAALQEEQPEEEQPEGGEVITTEASSESLPPQAPAGGQSAGVSSQFVSKVRAAIITAGGSGLTAKAIAVAVGAMEASTVESSSEFKEATRRVRQAARNAVDTTPGGSRNVREGKNVIYKILAS